MLFRSKETKFSDVMKNMKGNLICMERDGMGFAITGGLQAIRRIFTAIIVLQLHWKI